MSGRKVYSARCVFAFSALGSIGGEIIEELMYWQVIRRAGSTR